MAHKKRASGNIYFTKQPLETGHPLTEFQNYLRDQTTCAQCISYQASFYSMSPVTSVSGQMQQNSACKRQH